MSSAQLRLQWGAGRRLRSLFFFRVLISTGLIAGCFIVYGCSILATRPVQEMSDTSAALRAAREVQADTLAPELFRQAGEWFFKAKHEYKFKNFELARKYATSARRFAEQAEFEAIRNGGNRTEVPSAPESGPSPAPKASEAPYDYPAPTGTPVEDYDREKAAEDSTNKSGNQAPTLTPTTPTPVYTGGTPAAPVAPPPAAGGSAPTVPVPITPVPAH